MITLELDYIIPTFNQLSIPKQGGTLNLHREESWITWQVNKKSFLFIIMLLYPCHVVCSSNIYIVYPFPKLEEERLEAPIVKLNATDVCTVKCHGCSPSS